MTRFLIFLLTAAIAIVAVRAQTTGMATEMTDFYVSTTDETTDGATMDAATMTTADGATTADPGSFVLLTGELSFTGVTYSAALGNTSSPEFMAAQTRYSNLIQEGFCNATADGGECGITITVTGFRNGSLIIDYTMRISADNQTALDAALGDVLDIDDLVILDGSGQAFSVTYSAPTVVTDAPATTDTAGITCYVCETDDETHACATGADNSAFTSTQCAYGQRCLTLKLSNATYISITRGCDTSSTCTANSDSEDLSCQDSQTSNVDECSHCCNTDNCNSVDAGAAGLGPASMFVLLVSAAVATTLSSFAS